jgi:hypothetical protein
VRSRDAAIGKTDKIVVLPRFGGKRSKTFSFKCPSIIVTVLPEKKIR